MNSYATEQLARQRYDQVSREAHLDRLARLAQSPTPLSQPSGVKSPVGRVGGRVWRFGGAVLAAISRPMGRRRGADDSPIGSRATGPRQA
jgi:hypothetical protein